MTATPGNRVPVTTYAEYVTVVSAGVTDGTRKAYRPLLEPGGRAVGRPAPGRRPQLPAHGWFWRCSSCAQAWGFGSDRATWCSPVRVRCQVMCWISVRSRAVRGARPSRGSGWRGRRVLVKLRSRRARRCCSARANLSRCRSLMSWLLI